MSYCQSCADLVKEVGRLTAKLDASERALERVKPIADRARDLLRARSRIYEKVRPADADTKYFAAVDALFMAIAHADSKLTSPEARAKTTMGVTGSVIVPKTQPSHVCSVDYLPDGSIGCPRCSGFEDGPEARATGESSE